MVDKSVLLPGTKYVVRYMRYKNSYPAKDYMDALGSGVQAATLAVLKLFADGKQLSKSKGHFLEGKYSRIFEVKPQNHRFFGFLHKKNFYLVSGAPKANAKKQVGDYDRALFLYNDFFSRNP